MQNDNQGFCGQCIVNYIFFPSVDSMEFIGPVQLIHFNVRKEHFKMTVWSGNLEDAEFQTNVKVRNPKGNRCVFQ